MVILNIDKSGNQLWYEYGKDFGYYFKQSNLKCAYFFGLGSKFRIENCYTRDDYDRYRKLRVLW